MLAQPDEATSYGEIMLFGIALDASPFQIDY